MLNFQQMLWNVKNMLNYIIKMIIICVRASLNIDKTYKPEILFQSNLPVELLTSCWVLFIHTKKSGIFAGESVMQRPSSTVYVCTLYLTGLKIARPVHCHASTAQAASQQFFLIGLYNVIWLNEKLVCFNYVYNFHFNLHTFKEEKQIKWCIGARVLIWCWIST